MYDINVVLLSYRQTELAREIVAQCCDVATRMSGVMFSFGFGGHCNALKITYQEMINLTTDRGGEARMICCEDFSTRIDFCLNSAKQWILFISDDDIFSVNYLRSMIDATLHAEAHVSMINPSAYLLTNPGDATQIASRLIDDSDIRIRYRTFNDLPFRGIGFWGAHRSVSVIKWFTYFREKGSFPSYTDMILLTLGILSGACVSTREFTFISYDLSNWSNLDVTVVSDSKSYDKSQFVLFHELFWCVDSYKILKLDGLVEKIYNDYLVWWAGMMLRMVQMYSVRIQILKLDENLVPEVYIKKVIELVGCFLKLNFANQAEHLLNCFCDLEAEIVQILGCHKSSRLVA